MLRNGSQYGASQPSIPSKWASQVCVHMWMHEFMHIHIVAFIVHTDRDSSWNEYCMDKDWLAAAADGDEDDDNHDGDDSDDDDDDTVVMMMVMMIVMMIILLHATRYYSSWRCHRRFHHSLPTHSSSPHLPCRNAQWPHLQPTYLNTYSTGRYDRRWVVEENIDDDGDKNTRDEYHTLWCSTVIMKMMIIIVMMMMVLVLMMMISDTIMCSIQAHRPYRFEQRSLSVRSCSECMWWSMAWLATANEWADTAVVWLWQCIFIYARTSKLLVNNISARLLMQCSKHYIVLYFEKTQHSIAHYLST